MEPDEAAIRYVINTTVNRIFQSAEGPWFVHFTGSWEALSLGNERPALQVGDAVVITIQKAP